jgi:hypothetical protein
MPFEESANRTLVDFMPYLCFKSALDFACGGNFPALRSREKGS